MWRRPPKGFRRRCDAVLPKGCLKVSAKRAGGWLQSRGPRRHANSNGGRSPRSRQPNQRTSSVLPIRRQYGQTESPERSTSDPALTAVQTRLMFQAKPSLTPEVIRLHTHEGDELIAHLPRLQAYLCKDRPTPLSCDPTWLRVLRLG